MQAVAEFRQTAFSVWQYAAISRSNSLVRGPVVIHPERIVLQFVSQAKRNMLILLIMLRVSCIMVQVQYVMRHRRTDVRWRKWDIMQFHSERMIVELVNNGPGKGRIYLFIPPLA